MAEVRLSTGTDLVQVFLVYDTASAQATAIRYFNTSPFPARGNIIRNNGQPVSYTIPANLPAPGNTVAINPAQFTVTIDANGEPDIMPNYNFEWPL